MFSLIVWQTLPILTKVRGVKMACVWSIVSVSLCSVMFLTWLKNNWLNGVGHAGNLSTLVGQGEQISSDQEFKSSPVQHGKTPCTTNAKKKKLFFNPKNGCDVTACSPREWFELEPGRGRLQWMEIPPLHSCLGNRGRLSQKKKKKGQLTLKLKIKRKAVGYCSVFVLHEE